MGAHGLRAAKRRPVYAAGAALGAAHDVLVTRFEDMADLPEIARDVVPEFAPDFQRVSVHEGSHAPAAVEARKFRARAARLVAANYSYRFAACEPLLPERHPQRGINSWNHTRQTREW